MLKPYWFGISHFSEADRLILLVLIYTCIIPLISIGLLKFAGLIKSFKMEEKSERILPILVCLIFYLWMYINLRNETNLPIPFMALLLIAIISMSIAFIINIWVKLSLHFMVWSVILFFWIKIRFSFGEASEFYFKFFQDRYSSFHLNNLVVICILILGWVGTSRILLSAHNIRETYIGGIVGLVSVIIGFKIWS